VTARAQISVLYSMRAIASYDVLNRQTTVTDALNKVTKTAYDNVGNISSLTDPINNKTTFAYDELNRLKSDSDS
jgi:YD repeat-containing protein